MSEPAPRVTIVQHVPREGPGRIADALARARLEIDRVHVFANDEVPTKIGDAAGLVVMGGPMGVYERDRFPHLSREIALIEDAHARDVPVLGVCLGSQLVAHALGAHVRPSGEKEIGWLEVELLEGAHHDPLLSHAPPSFTPFHWHGDVFDLPPGATPLARSQRTPLQAFRRDRAWGLLFHAEATPEIVDGMTDAFADELRDVELEAEPLRRLARQNKEILDRIAAPVFDAWCAEVLRAR